jgi:5-methylcytosine-specific restriction endonuclease McrA
VFLEVYPQVLGVSTHKVCIKCGELKPATPEYFYVDGGRLRLECKACNAAKSREWYAANRDRKADWDKAYRAARPGEAAQKTRAWREANPGRDAKNSKAYRASHRKEKSASHKAWKAANPEKVKVNHHRYRASKRNLPNSFTAADWTIALDYFGHSCAACRQGLMFLSHGDHWIPLSSSDCPGTVPHNMVPLCSTCNTSKQDKVPADWLIERFGKRKGTAILRRIEAFLESRKTEVLA